MGEPASRASERRGFDARVGDFWRAWAVYQSPFDSDDGIDSAHDAMRDAYFVIMRMRAPTAGHVAEKLRIALTQRKQDWYDGRFDLMLSSILLDLEQGGGFTEL